MHHMLESLEESDCLVAETHFGLSRYNDHGLAFEFRAAE
jgi:hypothetical protein